MLETRWHLIRHAPVDNLEGGYMARLINQQIPPMQMLFSYLLKDYLEGIAITSYLKGTQQTLDAH